MTRETKSYELKTYDQSLMRFEAAYDAFGSLKLEITDIDSANAHLLPLNLIVDQDEKALRVGWKVEPFRKTGHL